MSNGPVLATLADFQQEAMEALAASIRVAAGYIVHDPAHRAEIARSAGVMLLESPTGSGKTLTLGRTLEAVRGTLPERCVWFWFAPFAGLVAQTREALAEQCPALRLRDLATDREPAGVRDGDVFVQTWASVAKANKESLRVRRGAEAAPSLDDMLAGLRADGVHVGVVIDEAHLNFGVNARAAADFYLNTLRPDFTLLATATPNDAKLAEFERAAGVRVESRVTVDRARVVKAALNKRGLKLGILRFSGADAALIEPEQAALAAGWDQHCRVKARLQERGIAVTPLMLVQVEDRKGEGGGAGPDPVERVRGKLVEVGVPASAIAVHTSGQPDPDFHILAHDPSREVLVFKVAVATGFDAPRAWTLVSVRPNRTTAFGLQIVGRIMRVHPAVRPIHGQDDLLDRGYVFLTDADLQAGLDSAAAELKAVRSSIAAISDELEVTEFSNGGRPLDGAGHHGISVGALPATPAEREQRLGALEAVGLVDGAAVRAKPEAEQDRAIVQAEWRRKLGETPLFGGLPDSPAPRPAAAPKGRVFKLRTELGVPEALRREVLPDAAALNGDILAGTARVLFRDHFNVLAGLLLRRKGLAKFSLHDLFIGGEIESLDVSVRMSAARIAEAAQRAFAFNENLDLRRFKAALNDEFRRRCDAKGMEYEPADLHRALDLFAMGRPDALKAAFLEAQAPHVAVTDAEPLPPLVVDPDAPLQQARLGAYEVFPPGMNKEERDFAEWLDADKTGRVRWWLRLQENTKWAVTLILPTGRRFFPDFAVGVEGRGTPGRVALVEIKDDGTSGRLHSDDNRLKIRVAHREYKNVAWTVREDGAWANAKLDRERDRIFTQGWFDVEALIHAQ